MHYHLRLRAPQLKGHSTEEKVCEILRNAVNDEGAVAAPLGSRIAARFASLGLTQDAPVPAQTAD